MIVIAVAPSKSAGIRVSVEPQTAHPLLKLTRPAPRSHTGAQERQAERPQQLHQLSGLLTRREEDCVRF